MIYLYSLLSNLIGTFSTVCTSILNDQVQGNPTCRLIVLLYGYEAGPSDPSVFGHLQYAINKFKFIFIVIKHIYMTQVGKIPQCIHDRLKMST
jgi:hypothetical protein